MLTINASLYLLKFEILKYALSFFHNKPNITHEAKMTKNRPQNLFVDIKKYTYLKMKNKIGISIFFLIF